MTTETPHHAHGANFDRFLHLRRRIGNSISGGYSRGHIIVTSEDGSIDHDSWARELDAYLESLAKAETLPPRSGGEGRVGGASTGNTPDDVTSAFSIAGGGS